MGENIFQIVLLIFALYGMASLLWEFNEKFFRQKNRNTVSYLAFLPLGDENSVEFEIRSCIDYAQEINAEPVILYTQDWSREKKNIARIISENTEVKMIHTDG